VVGSLGEGAKKLSGAGRKAANDQVAAVAHGLLDLDLGGLVIAAWGKWADLTAAAKRTFATQDSSEVVELAVHTITSTHRPLWSCWSTTYTWPPCALRWRSSS
jgi:hypothetical protein